MPNGTYGGVRGGAGDSPTYSITKATATEGNDVRMYGEIHHADMV